MNFGDTRATLLASFETILDTINSQDKKSYQGQVTMFDIGAEDETLNDIKYSFTVLPELSERELLSMEKEMLGIYISGHPLDKIREQIENNTNINTLKMLEIKENFGVNAESLGEVGESFASSKMDGKPVKFIGIISSIKKKYTKRNTIMAFVTIEDLYGNAEVIVFDTCYQKCSEILLVENIVLVDGRLSIREDEDVKIVANNISEFKTHEAKTDEVVKFVKQQEAETNNQIEEKDEVNNINIQTKPKILIINITNMDEITKAKLRGAIKFFSGDKNNMAVKVKNGEQLLPCGAIYLTEEILDQFKNIVGKENIKLM